MKIVALNYVNVQMKSIFYLGLYGCALLTCLFCFNRFKQLRYKLFLPFLSFIVLYQIGEMQKLFGIHKSNLWSVNIEVTIEFIFYSFFIISSSREPKEKRGFKIAAWAIFVFTLIDVFFIQGVERLCSIAIVMQYALLIIMVCRFFYGQMKVFDGETSLLKQPDFWVNTGLLFFSLSEFLFFAAFNLAYVVPGIFSTLFDIISAVANIILYSCLIVSFIWSRQQRKTVSY